MLKRILAGVTTLALALGMVALATTPASAAPAGGPTHNGDKVTICHSPSSASNPWVVLTVSVNSMKDDGHIDPSLSDTHADDIIPAFSYDVHDGGPNWHTETYPGKNLTTVFSGYTGAQILANGCAIPTPPPPVDVCANLDGAQGTVPAGYVQNGANCDLIPPPVDVCANLDGAQTAVPAGYVQNGVNCDPVTEDPIEVTVTGDATDQECVPSGDQTPGTLEAGSIQLTVSDLSGIASISYSTGNGPSTNVDLATLLIENLDPGTYDFVVTLADGYVSGDETFSVTVKHDTSTECAKVTLCHWTNGDHWNVLNISQAAVVTQGHSLPAVTDHGFDIIPPFGDYAGKNWDATSDNAPEAFGSYPFNGQQGSEIFPDCAIPDEPEDTDVSVVHGSTPEQCDPFDEFGVLGGSVTLTVYVGGVPVTLPNAAVTITVKGPGDLAYGPLGDLSDLPDGLYEFQVEVADGYVLTSPATFSEEVADKDAKDCGLTTLGPIVPIVTFVDPTCTVGGSYTLVSPAPEEGLPAKTVTWFVNDVETEAGTYPVTAPASLTVRAVATAGYTFEDFVTEITYPAHAFAVPAACGDLTTLALTGGDARPTLALMAFLSLLGVALLRSGARIARARQEA